MKGKRDNDGLAPNSKLAGQLAAREFRATMGLRPDEAIRAVQWGVKNGLLKFGPTLEMETAHDDTDPSRPATAAPQQAAPTV